MKLDQRLATAMQVHNATPQKNVWWRLLYDQWQHDGLRFKARSFGA